MRMRSASSSVLYWEGPKLPSKVYKGILVRGILKKKATEWVSRCGANHFDL